MKIKVIQTNEAPRAIGPYSQAIEAGDFIFISGQLPVDPHTGKIPATIENQAEQVMSNILAIMKAVDSALDYGDIVKTTVFLKDLEDFKIVNEIYAGFFRENYPARSAFEVARLPLDARLEIESIVYFPHSLINPIF